MDRESGAFDDTALAKFCDDHDVLSVYEHMLSDHGAPVWALLVAWRERSVPGEQRAPRAEREAELEIPEVDRAVFQALRRWRNDRAKRDGRPNFILFTNAQLAGIARVRPTTKAGLLELPGVGPSKVDEYGPEVLALLERLISPATAPGAPGG